MYRTDHKNKSKGKEENLLKSRGVFINVNRGHEGGCDVERKEALAPRDCAPARLPRTVACLVMGTAFDKQVTGTCALPVLIPFSLWRPLRQPLFRTPPRARSKPLSNLRGTRFPITGLGVCQGRNFSSMPHAFSSKSFLTSRAHLAARNTRFLESLHNILLKFKTQLPSFIIIWQVSFKKKIHLMKYFRLNTSALDLQKCTHLEYI